MKNPYLRISLLLLLSAGLSPSTTAATDLIPPATGHISGFCQDSFTAHWNPIADADSYALNVWSVGQEACSDVQDFSGHPAMLDYEHTYIVTQPVKGRITDIIIYGTLIDADDITDYTQTPPFQVELFDDAGNSLSFGQTYSWVFKGGYELHLADAFSTLYENLDHAVLSIALTEASVGSIRIDRITTCYDAYEYLLAEHSTTENSCLVNGIDPNVVYHFNVAAKKGNEQSAYSHSFKVDVFPVPVPAAPTTITADSYTALWEPSFKAEGYIVRHYATETTADNQPLAVLSDAFDGCNEGTYDKPVSISNPDLYTTKPGWTGNMMLMAQGALGAEGGQWINGRPQTGYLITPQMDLPSNNGIYDIHLKAKGTPGDMLAVYHSGYLEDGQLNIHYTQPFDADGWIEETWQMKDGSASMTLSIESKGMKQYFLDEIEVTQEVAEGTILKTLLATERTAGRDNCTCTFKDLNPGSTYAYDVRAYRTDFYGYEEETEASGLQMVALPDGIHSISIRPIGNSIFWHSLSGQHAGQPRQKGIFINQEGKKMLF